MELGLERVQSVLARMKLLDPPFRVATIGGTNGKGSVAAYLSALLRQTGHGPIGTYTSPHLRDYRERILVEDEIVGVEALVAAFETVEEARGETRLTYFEFTTLAALEAFRRVGVALAVLEVGLGGRLDAVNALDAEVAAVVSVGLDHQQWLGYDRESIGREKAGIFRQGKAAIIGDRDPPAALLQTAREQGAELCLIGRDFDAAEKAEGWTYHGTRWTLEHLPRPGMPGRFQLDNAAVALTLLEALEMPAPTHGQIAQALTGTRLAGRLDVRYDAVEWVLDVAHNPRAAATLADWLEQAEPRRTLAVFGMLADKDATGVAAHVAPFVSQWFLAPLAGTRGQSASELARKTAEVLCDPVLCENMASAVAAAKQAARGGDRIVVFGSFHTVKEALASGLIPPEDRR
jgi:dihydrofolate synthase/folylpolyglutamate synthase